MPIDSLNGFSFLFDGTDFFATKGTGADAVVKKLGESLKNIEVYDAKIISVSNRYTTNCSVNIEKGLYFVISGDLELVTTNHHVLRDRTPFGDNIDCKQVSNYSYLIEAYNDTTLSISVGPCGSGSNGGGQGWIFAYSLK